MPEPQLPTSADVDRNSRAAQAMAIAGRSSIALVGMDSPTLDRLAEMVDAQGRSIHGSQHRERVRLVLLEYHESKKASDAADDPTPVANAADSDMAGEASVSDEA